MQHQHRPSPRHVLSHPLRVERVPSVEAPPHLLGFAQNVSQGGAFLHCLLPPPVGTQLSLRFRLPGDDRAIVSGRARVIWSRGHVGRPGPPAGVGVQLVELPAGSRQIWERFCAGLSKAH